MKLIQTLLVAASLTVAIAAPASANLITAAVAGPDDGFGINIRVTNRTRRDSLTLLTIDGSTATAGPIIWDSVGTVFDPLFNTTISGVDTSLLSIAATGWGRGETLRLVGVDPDFLNGRVGVRVSELAGVTLGATWRSGAMANYVFTDNPIARRGLRAADDIPVPGTLALLGIALAGFGAVNARKARKSGKTTA